MGAGTDGDSGTWAGELRQRAFWRDLVGEFLATFLLLTSVCAVSATWDDPADSALRGPLAVGFTLAILVEVFGEFGGSHVNPAVTIAMLLAFKISPLKAIFYFIVQVAGALAGTGFIYGMTPSGRRVDLAVTRVPEEVELWQAVLMEVFLTSLLILTIFGTTNQARRPVYMPAIPIGLSLTVIALCGGPYSGASVNPVRSLAPAIISNVWDDHWVYWVGPIGGGICATLIYITFLNRIDGQLKTASKADTQDSDTKNGTLPGSISSVSGQMNEGFVADSGQPLTQL